MALSTESAKRIALALERIAAALERQNALTQQATSPITVTLDGKSLSQQMVQYTLKNVARGPSSLTGSSLVTKKEEPEHGREQSRSE